MKTIYIKDDKYLANICAYCANIKRIPRQYSEFMRCDDCLAEIKKHALHIANKMADARGIKCEVLRYRLYRCCHDDTTKEWDKKAGIAKQTQDIEKMMTIPNVWELCGDGRNALREDVWCKIYDLFVEYCSGDYPDFSDDVSASNKCGHKIENEILSEACRCIEQGFAARGMRFGPSIVCFLDLRECMKDDSNAAALESGSGIDYAEFREFFWDYFLKEFMGDYKEALKTIKNPQTNLYRYLDDYIDDQIEGVGTIDDPRRDDIFEKKV